MSDGYDPRPAIGRFVAAARAYCAWVESGDLAGEEAVFLASLQLASLYAAGLELPAVDFEALDDGIDVESLSHESRVAILSRLRVFPMQYYWEMFHATKVEADEPPCLGDVTDDLLDVYADVREGLDALDAGHEPLAVWHWRTTLGFHWGRHATCALKALHEFGAERAP